MNDIDKGWLCGIIDADGSISFARRRRKLKLTNFGHTWTPKIEVSSVCKEEIDNIQRICENRGNTCWHYPKRGKPSLRWALQANGCRWLLPQIAKHLVTKKKQAELLLEVLKINVKRGRTERPREAEEKLQEIYKKIRKLHQRGLQAMNYQKKYKELKVRN